jgi:hypothetical protein
MHRDPSGPDNAVRLSRSQTHSNGDDDRVIKPRNSQQHSGVGQREQSTDEDPYKGVRNRYEPLQRGDHFGRCLRKLKTAQPIARTPHDYGKQILTDPWTGRCHEPEHNAEQRCV